MFYYIIKIFGIILDFIYLYKALENQKFYKTSASILYPVSLESAVAVK